MMTRNLLIATSIAALTAGSFAYAQNVTPQETPDAMIASEGLGDEAVLIAADARIDKSDRRGKKGDCDDDDDDEDDDDYEDDDDADEVDDDIDETEEDAG